MQVTQAKKNEKNETFFYRNVVDDDDVGWRRGELRLIPNNFEQG